VNELVAGAPTSTPAEDDLEDEDRAVDATPLDLFLQKVTLLTDVDRHDPDAQAVTLMTVHNAKGLEFPSSSSPAWRTACSRSPARTTSRTAGGGAPPVLRRHHAGRAQAVHLHARTRRRAGEVMPGGRPASSTRCRRTVDEVTTPGWSARATGRDALVAARRRARRRLARLPRPAPRATRFEGADDGVYIDYSDAQDAPRFVKGERVRHPQFGRGVIRELTGFGQDLKAVIDFDSIGRKKVVLRYANLQKEL
jgi:DNA helicase II / ATP-dependent DNA helicase PcrA